MSALSCSEGSSSLGTERSEVKSSVNGRNREAKTAAVYCKTARVLHGHPLKDVNKNSAEWNGNNLLFPAPLRIRCQVLFRLASRIWFSLWISVTLKAVKFKCSIWWEITDKVFMNFHFSPTHRSHSQDSQGAHCPRQDLKSSLHCQLENDLI